MARSSRRVVVTALLLAVCAPAAATVRTDGSKPMPIGIYNKVTSVPAATLDAVGAGKVLGAEGGFFGKKLTGAAITRDGKPVFLSVNLAWCPHCAANSWAIAVALSRFGHFAKLRTIDTGTHFNAFQHTKGISFLDNGYTSDYLEFDPVIQEDLQGKPFQKPTTAQKQAIKPVNGCCPAINIAGLYAFGGSGYNPGALGGAKKGHKKIANALRDPANPIAKRVDGLANLFTAAICATTGQQPADVCGSPGVQAAAAGLPT